MGQPVQISKTQHPVPVQGKDMAQSAIHHFTLQESSVSSKAQLLTSADPHVQQKVKDSLRCQLDVQRQKFPQVVVVRDVQAEDPSQTRRRVLAVVKSHVKMEDADKEWAQLCFLQYSISLQEDLQQLARQLYGHQPTSYYQRRYGICPELDIRN